MAEAKYHVLEEGGFQDQNIFGTEIRYQDGNLRKKQSRAIWILAVLLVSSIILNIVLGQRCLNIGKKPTIRSLVDLPTNVPTPIPHDNRTIDDEMWHDPRYDTFVGMIAIDDKTVEQHSLLPAQRWPWDRSKSMYMLYGFHSLHCVYVIRDTLMEFRDQRPLTWEFPHVTHCLHVLREDTICAADDTPRYTGALNSESGKHSTSSGTGELRMCRDWDKLRQYAVNHSACYRVPLYESTRTIDRYKSCPNGNKPWEHVTS